MKRALASCVLALGLIACEGDGARTTMPTSGGNLVGCKSPFDGSSVPRDVAVAQARTILAQRRADLKLADTVSTSINVKCGDTFITVTGDAVEEG